jgi:osmotically-inducible protein OsmY
MRSSARGFLFGVGTAYFFDPRLGKLRRNVVRERGARQARELRRKVHRRARFSTGRAYGMYAGSRRIVGDPEVGTDDAVVEQRIRSEALRDVGVPVDDIEIGVEDGLVTLTGEVAGDELASNLVARVSKVPGVEDVAAMLHVVADKPDETTH